MAQGKTGKADTIGAAFAQTLRDGVREAAAETSPRTGRNRINVLAEIARDIKALTDPHECLGKTNTALKAAVKEGQEASKAMPRFCVECGEQYWHQPPATTTTMCDFCTTETKNMGITYQTIPPVTSEPVTP